MRQGRPAGAPFAHIQGLSIGGTILRTEGWNTGYDQEDVLALAAGTHCDKRDPHR